jgi:hypothetical protein
MGGIFEGDQAQNIPPSMGFQQGWRSSDKDGHFSQKYLQVNPDFLKSILPSFEHTGSSRHILDAKR